jgi:hypothetical protein
VARLAPLIDRDHSGSGWHRRPNTRENLAAAFVAPVVQDPLEHVDVRARFEDPEQVSRTPLHSLLETPRGEKRFCLPEHVRRVDQDAAGPRAAGQDLGQQSSHSTGDVAYNPSARPPICAGNGRRVDGGQLTHGLGEPGALVVMFSEVLPDRVAERPAMTRRLRSVAQQLLELRVRARGGGCRYISSPRGDRVGVVATQWPAETRQLDAAVAVVAHQPRSRRSVEDSWRHRRVEA